MVSLYILLTSALRSFKVLYWATVCLKGELKDSSSGTTLSTIAIEYSDKSNIQTKNAGQFSKDGEGLSSASRELDN